MFGKFSPTSNKVSNGTTLGLLGTLVSAALIYFIPAWQSGIPSFWQMVIAGGIGAVGYFGGGWMSKHQATMNEIQTALSDAQKLMDITHVPTIQLGTGSLTSLTPQPVKDAPQA